MDIHPAGTPVDDPFFGAVRRRHPDVDVVLLPSGQPARPDRPARPASDEDAAGAVQEAVATVGEVWAAAAPLTEKLPDSRLVFGSGPDTVRASARVVDHRTDGFGVLVSLRHQLEGGGWDLDRPGGDLERLVGRRGEETVTASYAEQTGTFVLELTSSELLVGADRARRLVRTGV